MSDSSRMMGYSVAIRSAGNAEYLDNTLASLAKQTPLPSEVVLVLPHGVEYQDKQGLPVVVHHAKACMIGQRDAAVLACSREVIVVMDDDILLDSPTALMEMIRLLEDKDLDVVVPYPRGLYPSGLNKMLRALFLVCVPGVFKKELKHLPSGGFRYPSGLSPGETCPADGGVGALFCVRNSFISKHHIVGDEDFKKLEFPSREDGCYFQILGGHGARMLMTGSCPFTHIGVTHRRTKGRWHACGYGIVVTDYLFWKKYIFPRRAAVLSIPAFAWASLGRIVLNMLRCARHRTIAPMLGMAKGYVDLVTGNWKFSRHG